MPEPTTLALITKTEVKAYFDISNTDYDNLIDAHLPGVRKFVEEYCRHDFLSTTRTSEKPYLARYDTEFYLNYYPIVSVSALTEDGVTLTQDTDFYVDLATGRVEKISNDEITNPDRANLSYWTSDRNAIVVTYVGGHALTDDATMAVKEMVGIDCGLKKRTYTDNEGVERVATLSAYPKHIMAVLDRHRYRGRAR